ncbi:hypothetical protein COCCADRAFT_96420 [Bipolaris zeicola 26-R-13]|uniref:Uncharacterized protein n=1 Tax=Cochliobolus carbonum (strain 26-R-13) TaxID=930089 RepID=W6YCQ3_COCC2|nr:uncharacterized protein COCCADRAFT_96420 [Bipolaris zeicola 26-R-13]EUC33294.1 hypothetical protein COCCADRAFT_96420 [Bipolaris zeicola 26-R-13]
MQNISCRHPLARSNICGDDVRAGGVAFLTPQYPSTWVFQIKKPYTVLVAPSTHVDDAPCSQGGLRVFGRDLPRLAKWPAEPWTDVGPAPT